MGIGEADAGRGDRVEVRRLHCRRAVAAEISVTDIVGVDKDDVGAVLGRREGGLTRRRKSVEEAEGQDQSGE